MVTTRPLLALLLTRALLVTVTAGAHETGLIEEGVDLPEMRGIVMHFLCEPWDAALFAIATEWIARELSGASPAPPPTGVVTPWIPSLTVAMADAIIP